MPAYTNLGIQQIDNGTQAGSWGTITNNNFEYFDTAICGVLPVTISVAANTDLDVANYAPASPDGRNRVLVFSSATNLGAVCNVRITKNSSTGAPYFEGYYFVRNSLNTSDLIIYQGATIPGAANYARIPNGQDAIVLCFVTGGVPIVGVFLQNTQFSALSGTSGVGLPVNSAAASGPALSTTVPAKLMVGPGTYTDNVTPASTTVANAPLNILRTSAIAASNPSVTYTNAYTLYIENAPTAGSNVTITNSYAAYIANGKSYFGDAVTIGATTFSGPSLSGSNAAKLTVGAGIYTDTSSAGTISFGCINLLSTPTVAASVAGRIYTTLATVYIPSSPVAGTNVTITNPYALYVGGGGTGTGAFGKNYFAGNTGVGITASDYYRFQVRSEDSASTSYAARFLNFSSANLFSARSDGTLNTGTTANSPYNNVVSSTPKIVYVNSAGELGYLSSSLRYKENIENVSYGLNEVLNLRSVIYNYKTDPDAPKSIGFIAEEVEELVPEAVYYKDGQPDALNYEFIIPLLAKAIQEQQAMIEDLKARVAALGG
jgi:hypothetical protein